MVNTTGRPTAPLVLSSDEREYLTRQVRRHRVARSMSERCRVILRCEDGLPSKAVAAELGVHEHTVGKWRRRFLKDRVEGLLDEMRPGRPRTIDDDQIAAVIERTLRSTPTDATHWSIRSMAGVYRIFKDDDPQDLDGVRPCSRIARRPSSFLRRSALSSTRSAILSASICRTLNRALVLSVDEKSQIQALDREQPVLPMMLGVPWSAGPTPISVMVRLRYLPRSMSPRVLSSANATKRHRATEFLDFLKRIDAQVPNGLDVHIIMDNYATHKTAAIKAWLARRPH